MTSSSSLEGTAAPPAMGDHPLTAFGHVGTVLYQTLASGRLASSYLFEGSDEEGLRTAAEVFAACILAESPPGPPAGRAYELARVRRHPDLHRLERDKATVISVAALSVVLEQAHAKPFEGAHQVFIVDPADAMEPAGIARYLKTLEEPPAGTVFILLTTHADRLPQTVLSRCARLRFAPLRASQIARRLEDGGAEPPDAAEIARAAGGSLGRAQRIADAGLCTLARRLAEVGMGSAPDTAAGIESVRAALEKSAKDLASADSGPAEQGRQAVRTLLDDLIYVLCVDVRSAAAGRGVEYVRGLAPRDAIDLLGRWGELSASVHRNVTPVLILFELVRTLRTANEARLS